ncbi:MAG: collagen-like protein [Bacteroidota bacterium]
MKKTVRNLSVAFMLLLCFQCSLTDVFGQAPQKVSYQAVIRNAGDALVALQTIGMQVTISQGATPVYVETHTPTTNANGLATIEIGNGTVVSGTFATIDWSAGPYFIKTETDPTGGTTYTITATQELLSVPFALYAANSAPGPTGPTGAAGTNGVDGATGADGPTGPAGPTGVVDVNCRQCHNHDGGTSEPDLVGEMTHEYEFSKHSEEELAVEEGYSAGCAPCHSHEGFTDVVTLGTYPQYTFTTKYAFSYNASASQSSALTHLPNTIGCFTCHKTGETDSLDLSTTAAVPMSMYPVYPVGDPLAGSEKTIDLTQNNSQSNLCVKCHQPRPSSHTSSTTVTLASGTVVTLNAAIANGASVNYADLAANPLNTFYDSVPANANLNKLFPSYRTGNHYGVVGGIFAGLAGVQFAGSMSYTDISTHPVAASCQDCHMATPTGFTGGHTFRVAYIAEGDAAPSQYNFKGCLITGCHSTMSTTNAMWTATRANSLSLLQQIAAKLTSGGIEIMQKETDIAENIYAYVTPEGYSGYLDVYDPSSNPTGVIQNPVTSSSWTAANKTYNLSLPRLTNLLNVQMGAILNFQLCLREASLGVHNPKYSTALLQNTLEALVAAGF